MVNPPPLLCFLPFLSFVCFLVSSVPISATSLEIARPQVFFFSVFFFLFKYQFYQFVIPYYTTAVNYVHTALVIGRPWCLSAYYALPCCTCVFLGLVSFCSLIAFCGSKGLHGPCLHPSGGNLRLPCGYTSSSLNRIQTWCVPPYGGLLLYL